MTKYSVKDIEKALAFFKAKGASAVSIEVDENYRVQMSMSTDANGNGITVTVYSTGAEDIPNKMPEVTETRRL